MQYQDFHPFFLSIYHVVLMQLSIVNASVIDGNDVWKTEKCVLLSHEKGDSSIVTFAKGFFVST